jgi:hypothetical protein
MSMQTQSPLEKMVFRKTNNKGGRNISVTPSNSTNKHLSYGRIILDAQYRRFGLPPATRRPACFVWRAALP